MPHAPAMPMVWAATSDRTLHGRLMMAAEAPPEARGGLEQGLVQEFEPVPELTGLAAWDAVASAPGAFTVITAEQSRVDFDFFRPTSLGPLDRLLGLAATHVAVDIWFEEEPSPEVPDSWTLTIAAGRELVAMALAGAPDASLWAALPRLAGKPE